MKIALSADNHLSSRGSHPGRYRALENILDQMGEEITAIILAGDVFDMDLRNYSDFEKAVGKKKYKGTRILIIPGNHDKGLSAGDIVAENVEILAEPRLLTLEGCDLPFLMIPYSDERTVGEVLEAFSDQLVARKWILVGHGDWAGNLKQVNAYEPGVYMPLTISDIDRHKPLYAFLGHTHMGGVSGNIYQLGSPYPLNINETRKRTFTTLDTETQAIEFKEVDTDVIFFNERIVMLPTEDEKGFIEAAVIRMLEDWELTPDQLSKVRLRLQVRGYCSDRAALKTNLEAALGQVKFYEDEGVDLSELSIADDFERRLIAEKIRQRIDELDWKDGADEPDRDQILLEALATIYGGE